MVRWQQAEEMSRFSARLLRRESLASSTWLFPLPPSLPPGMLSIPYFPISLDVPIPEYIRWSVFMSHRHLWRWGWDVARSDGCFPRWGGCLPHSSFCMRLNVSRFISDNEEHCESLLLKAHLHGWLSPGGVLLAKSGRWQRVRNTLWGTLGGNRDLLAQRTWFIQRHLLYWAV